MWHGYEAKKRLYIYLDNIKSEVNIHDYLFTLDNDVLEYLCDDT